MEGGLSVAETRPIRPYPYGVYSTGKREGERECGREMEGGRELTI